MAKKYTSFTIRKDKPRAEDKFAKCYIRENTGGWSACILGNPTDDECNVLSNCVGYACGRFNEIYDEIRGVTGCKYKYFNGNPPSVPDRIKQFYPWLKMDKTPRPGDMIVWQDHVAICENIISDNEILITDSAYRGAAFRSYKIKKGDGNWGRKVLIGFMHNSAVEEWEEPDIPVTQPVNRNELVDQINIDIDNYSNCRIAPSTSAKVIGTFKAGWYNVLGISQSSNYVWYKVADQNYVAGTNHIHYKPKTIPKVEIFYDINKDIPAEVIHNIPDKSAAGNIINLEMQAPENYKIKSIKIDEEEITNTTYIMPEHNIDVEVEIKSNDDYNLFYVIFQVILKFFKLIFNAD